MKEVEHLTPQAGEIDPKTVLMYKNHGIEEEDSASEASGEVMRDAEEGP